MKMKAKKYFKKYGEIYGTSSKLVGRGWQVWVVKFTDWKKAIDWLNQEEWDFRVRELVTKTEAKKYIKKEI